MTWYHRNINKYTATIFLKFYITKFILSNDVRVEKSQISLNFTKHKSLKNQQKRFFVQNSRSIFKKSPNQDIY